MNDNPKSFTALETAILKTLVYFDIFDYPLTLVEIHKWLYRPPSACSIWTVSQALLGENLKGLAESNNGFYFLGGRREIIASRLDRCRPAEKKFRIARKAAWWLRRLPFLKVVAVCNNAGYNNAAPSSDIDFFIIIRQGWLYLMCLLVTLAVSLLGRRRHGKKIADRVCLSFYIADRHLNLADIALKPEDIYLVYWFATLAPIYDQGAYQEFLAANAWLKDYLPNFYPAALTGRRKIEDDFLIKFGRNFKEKILAGIFGDGLERLAKLLQLNKMKKHPSFAGNDFKVVISDSRLKFHENDRRREYLAAWEERLGPFAIS